MPAPAVPVGGVVAAGGDPREQAVSVALHFSESWSRLKYSSIPLSSFFLDKMSTAVLKDRLDITAGGIQALKGGSRRTRPKSMALT